MIDLYVLFNDYYVIMQGVAGQSKEIAHKGY